MRKFGVLLAVVVFCIPAYGEDILGFSPKRVREQLELEAALDKDIKAAELNTWMQRLTARPHYLGNPYDKDNAEYIASLFTSWGYETEIATYQVLFPTPKIRQLELIEPVKYTAGLTERPLAEDATSQQIDEHLPVYNAFSTDGEVTAEVVYVNYGIPADYEELERRGIDVKGKIVLARYAGSWRGIKPKVAAEKGAIGTIIYSDPRDDGFVRGDVYPKGPFRNDMGAQRGSVMDMPLYPGDVLTPGVGATPKAKRLKRKDAATITRIPVLPISYSDALPILKALGGPVAPDNWKGGLPVTYHLGPGPAIVHLKLEFNWDMVNLYDVIARMEGKQYPDQWVIRGNHHDAWVSGASDPTSGMVALLAEAKAIGTMVRAGYQPKRTIIFAAWDAEEEGLIGSTEWAEHHREELQEKAVVYINSDSTSRGFLGVGGSHTLEKMVNQVAHKVMDPQVGATVFDRRQARELLKGGDARKTAQNRKDMRLSPLGSGSDYTPFLQHLSIASLNIGYRGESSGGSYHSVYDSYDHFTRFVDPGFAYGVVQAKTTGRITMRFANADYLPFDFAGFTDNLSLYLDEIIKMTDKLRLTTQIENELIDKGSYQLALDPTKAIAPPKKQAAVPHIAFAKLKNALDHLKGNTQKISHALENFKLDSMSSRDREKLDKLLFQSERILAHPKGLPRRPWYKHTIYAPGFYTGYGVKTIPGVREAIEQRDWTEVDDEIEIASQVISDFSDYIGDIANFVAPYSR